MRLTSYFKIDDFVDFQIKNETLQNYKKEMGYRGTDARTDARTKTIFLVNEFKNAALRAGQKGLLLLGLGAAL